MISKHYLSSSEPLTFEQYRQRSYILALDGLRAISILFVIAAHMDVVRLRDGGLWAWLSGESGVRVFFVLSGYLITMLCLREEEQRGHLSIPAFYARRAFRILPAYYVTLGIYAFLIFGGVLGAMDRHVIGFRHAMPYYLFYMNEFAPPAAFYQSWSLGVEEKFYLVWPILAFVLLRAVPSYRFQLAVVMTAFFTLLRYSDFLAPYRLWGYGDIFFGCVVGIALNSVTGFRVLRILGASALSLGVVILFAVTQLLLDRVPDLKIVYGVACALLLISAVTSRSFVAHVLSWFPLVWIGRRAYAIYLLHVLAIQGVTRIIPDGAGVPLGMLAFLLSALASLFLAEALHRGVERPLIGVGRVVSRRIMDRNIESNKPQRDVNAVESDVAG